MIKCSATQPCSAQQLLVMSRAGGMLTTSMQSIVRDVKLPTFVSQVGLSTIQSVAGGIEGIIGKGLNELQTIAGVSDEQLGLVTDIGARVVNMIALGTGNVDPFDATSEFVSMATKIGTEIATEVAKDAAGVIPIVGSVIAIVIDIAKAITAAFAKPPHVLADAVAEEKARQEMCGRVVSASGVVPTGDSGALPCDLFNGAINGPWFMPPGGAVLIRASEENPGIPVIMRRTLKSLRVLIQGASRSQVRGLDPFTNSVVPITPGVSSDGGQSLWPVYMDIMLRYRQLGALSNDQLYGRINSSAVGGPAGCAREYWPYGEVVLENWRDQKHRIDTGTGYFKWDAVKRRHAGPLVQSELASLKLVSAFYTGKEVGAKYTLRQSGSTLALVGGSPKVMSFSSRLSSRSAPAKMSGAVAIIPIAVGAAGYWLWRRKRRG